MESFLALFESLQDLVVNPTWGSALILALASTVNEVVAIFPLSIVISTQLIFTDSLTLTLILKLIFLVSIPVGIGSAIGTLPLFYLSYFGGRKAIEKFKSHLRFSWSDVEKVNSKFQGQWYDEILFVFIRALPIIPSIPLTIVAGIVRMSFGKYLVLTIVGLSIRMIFSLLIFGIGFINLSKLLVLIYNI